MTLPNGYQLNYKLHSRDRMLSVWAYVYVCGINAVNNWNTLDTDMNSSDPSYHDPDTEQFRCLQYFTAVRRCVCK